jgi:flagellar hook-basal body complex protein FliE
MVIGPIDPISIAQVSMEKGAASPAKVYTGNPFEDILSDAVRSLEDVSRTEAYASELMNRYVSGRAELSDVLVASSKASIAVQLGVTVITTAVSTFKEIYQMPV